MLIERLARATAVICAASAMGGGVWTRDVFFAFAVLGGGVLIGLSFWAIRGTVNRWLDAGKSRENLRESAGLQLVNFFTRHAIVAVAAYGMMVRLHLDPLGLLLGVSSLGMAVAVEAVRGLRWRRFP